MPRELDSMNQLRVKAERECRELREALAAKDAELASVKASAEAMHKWIDRVLSCVERAEQDIGGETMAQIIPDGGPIYDAYRAAHPKEGT